MCLFEFVHVWAWLTSICQGIFQHFVIGLLHHLPHTLTCVPNHADQPTGEIWLLNRTFYSWILHVIYSVSWKSYCLQDIDCHMPVCPEKPSQLPLPQHELIMLLTAEAQSYKSYLRTKLHIKLWPPRQNRMQRARTIFSGRFVTCNFLTFQPVCQAERDHLTRWADCPEFPPKVTVDGTVSQTVADVSSIWYNGDLKSLKTALHI